MTGAVIVSALAAALDAQLGVVSDWHLAEAEEKDLAPEPGAPFVRTLRDLVLIQHLMNFRLWHVEDTSRRTDVADSLIAECKRHIDGLNQRRNDWMEKVDETLLLALSPLLPSFSGRPRHNTESPGMAVDRLSILALKIYHMAEQTERPDAGPGHRAACAAKLASLREQRGDLVRALLDLLEDFLTGRKQPKVCYHFKMYNDPDLNPELYTVRKN
jgi:hypothetical protein